MGFTGLKSVCQQHQVLSGGSRGECVSLCLCFQRLWTSLVPGPFLPFKVTISRLCPSHIVPLWPCPGLHVSFFDPDPSTSKDTSQYVGPTWVIQDNLVLGQLMINLNSLSQVPVIRMLTYWGPWLCFPHSPMKLSQKVTQKDLSASSFVLLWHLLYLPNEVIFTFCLTVSLVTYEFRKKRKLVFSSDTLSALHS